jgi:hypothetical protein
MTILISTVYAGVPAFGASKVGAPEIAALNVKAPKVDALKAHAVKAHAQKVGVLRVGSSNARTLKVNTRDRSASPAPAALLATKTIVVPIYPSRSTGQSVSYVAHVTPVEPTLTKLTGSVSWKLVGNLGGRVYCSTVSALRSNGQAKCKITKGLLAGIKGPMSVTASYSGSTTFAKSLGKTTQHMISHGTSLQIQIADPIMAGGPTVAYATMKGGYGISMISGNVTFIVYSGDTRSGITTNCGGADPDPTVNNTRRVINGVATCYLHQGWIIVPPFMGTRYRTNWSITATYNGNVSFGPSTSTKRGWISNNG